MSHKNDSPQPWSFRIASRYYRSEAKVFGFCVALGCLLALIATSILDLSDVNRWRSVFVTWPVLFSFGFAAIAIGLVKLMHAIAGLKFSPMSIERIENWASFGFIEKFQVYFLILVLLTLSSGMGWVIGGLVSLTWRA